MTVPMHTTRRLPSSPPLAQPAAAATTAAPAAATASTAAFAPPPPRRVLIVDDSRAIQALIRRCLESAELGPLQIQTAGNGLDALEQVARFQPELVLADWHMPGLSGLEMLQRLREAGFEHLPVGFITMDRGSDCQRRAQQHGALFLLHKPFSESELRQAVARGLQLTPAPRDIEAAAEPA